MLAPGRRGDPSGDSSKIAPWRRPDKAGRSRRRLRSVVKIGMIVSWSWTRHHCWAGCAGRRSEGARWQRACFCDGGRTREGGSGRRR